MSGKKGIFEGFIREIGEGLAVEKGGGKGAKEERRIGGEALEEGSDVSASEAGEGDEGLKAEVFGEEGGGVFVAVEQEASESGEGGGFVKEAESEDRGVAGGEFVGGVEGPGFEEVDDIEDLCALEVLEGEFFGLGVVAEKAAFGEAKEGFANAGRVEADGLADEGSAFGEIELVGEAAEGVGFEGTGGVVADDLKEHLADRGGEIEGFETREEGSKAGFTGMERGLASDLDEEFDVLEAFGVGGAFGDIVDALGDRLGCELGEEFAGVLAFDAEAVFEEVGKVFVGGDLLEEVLGADLEGLGGVFLLEGGDFLEGVFDAGGDALFDLELDGVLEEDHRARGGFGLLDVLDLLEDSVLGGFEFLGRELGEDGGFEMGLLSVFGGDLLEVAIDEIGGEVGDLFGDLGLKGVAEAGVLDLLEGAFEMIEGGGDLFGGEAVKVGGRGVGSFGGLESGGEFFLVREVGLEVAFDLAGLDHFWEEGGSGDGFGLHLRGDGGNRAILDRGPGRGGGEGRALGRGGAT